MDNFSSSVFPKRARYSKNLQKLWPVLLGLCLMGFASCDSIREEVTQYKDKLIYEWKSFEFKKIKPPPQRRFYAGSSQWQMLPMAIGSAVVLVLLAYFYSKYWERQAQRKSEMKKMLIKLEKFFDQLEIMEEDEMLMGELMETLEPSAILRLIESVEEFEARVEVFKNKRPDEKTLTKIYYLRHKLGFGFYNKQIPFLCTQMLTSSEKLECSIEFSKKTATFISPILLVTEHFLLIKPPSIKGRPVNIKKYSRLICRICRNDDADYQFTLSILRQITGKVNAVVLGHTWEIEKRLLRHADRVAVNIPSLFYAVSEKHMLLYTDQSQSLSSTNDLPKFQGKIVDLSSGGAKILTSELPLNFPDDALLLFPLQEANISGDLTARILDIHSQEQEHSLHLQFFRLREMKRIRLNRFITKIKNHELEKKEHY